MHQHVPSGKQMLLVGKKSFQRNSSKIFSYHACLPEGIAREDKLRKHMSRRAGTGHLWKSATPSQTTMIQLIQIWRYWKPSWTQQVGSWLMSTWLKKHGARQKWYKRSIFKNPDANKSLQNCTFPFCSQSTIFWAEPWPRLAPAMGFK